MSKTVTLQLLQTSDVHGYVYPTSYVTGNEQAMGLAKIQTKIKQIERPNRLLFDTGDIIQGSPLTYYYSVKQPTPIHPMAAVINQMNYDYISIGNHEFNYGLNVLHGYVDHMNPTILNGNLLHEKTNKPFVGVSHVIKQLEDGPTLGIIGVTTHYIPNWEQPSHIDHLIIKDAFETTKQLVQLIQNQVDFIIVNYHGGFERNLTTFELDTEDTGENQGSKMLQELPNIDVLFTGHQHRLLQGTHGTTTYTQPGFNAQHLAELLVTFTYDDGWNATSSVTIHDVSDVAPDPTILSLLQQIESDTQSYLDTPVGSLDMDYLITNQLEARLNKHPLVSLINHIQLEFTKADISICSLGNGVSGFKQSITIRDIIGTYPFPNTLVVKEITGAELLRAMEQSAGFFTLENNKIDISSEFNHPKLQLYAYDMYDPIEYTIDMTQPRGSRIQDARLNGHPIELTKPYNVVMNNYRASGGGDYLFIKKCPVVHDTQQEVIDLLIQYIVANQHISIPHTNNITIRK